MTSPPRDDVGATTLTPLLYISEESKTCFSRQFGERNGGLARVCPLAGPTELLAPCFFVEIHRPEPQLCDERISARGSGDPRSTAPMVSLRPDSGRRGLFLGLPPSHGLEHGAMLEQLIMCSGLSSQNSFIRLVLSCQGEERRASSPP
jgi:hypothetical protein